MPPTEQQMYAALTPAAQQQFRKDQAAEELKTGNGTYPDTLKKLMDGFYPLAPIPPKSAKGK